ncbi:protein cereblon [Orussus abietinus]|uniref:protein cereblon n=1 Tax=Orussus abietinus TaxID=222816 RepID=UPI0006263F15|nr:protein cereblon [Orussus abietinus]
MSDFVESDEDSHDSQETNCSGQDAAGVYSELNADADEEPVDSTFDLTLPTSHSYLGNDLEDLRGRTILDNGVNVLPLLLQHSVVLFPGQTLPMTVSDVETFNMLQKCILGNRTFGVCCLRMNEPVSIGTTAEIYQYTIASEAQRFQIKAKGRQRFKILKVNSQGGSKTAYVKILPEETLGPANFDERLVSLDHLRVDPTNEKEAKLRNKLERTEAAMTPFPAWVYRQYDAKRLSTKIRRYLHFIQKRGINIPSDPMELSFWVAQNLVLDDNEKLALLSYNSAIPRLQKEIKYLINDKVLVCSHCNRFIGKRTDMFPMSKEGTQNTYCNPVGRIFDTVTLYTAEGLNFDGYPPSTEFSWFPGYAWIVVNCQGCNIHMGWRFTAVEEDLKPAAFYGLVRKALCFKKLNKDKNYNGNNGEDFQPSSEF